jgi:hypothetical protein
MYLYSMQSLCNNIAYYKTIPNIHTVSVSKLISSYECPDEIINRLPALKFSIQYTSNILSIPIKISFYTLQPNLCLDRFNIVMTILRLFKPTTSVTVDFLLTDIQKQLPKSGPVGPSTLNTGYASDKIVVYREEEWLKVFIHECMHLFEFDNALRDKQKLIQTLFPLKISVELNESYCEVWARILNCCVISVYNSVSVYDLIKKESDFSISQMNKVLNYMNLNYNQLFDPKTVYTENTNAFAYLVLGAILMTNPYKFIEWCVQHNSVFKVTDSDEYIKLIKSMYKVNLSSEHSGTSTKMTINNIDL